jgi:hypothetical protein
VTRAGRDTPIALTVAAALAAAILVGCGDGPSAGTGSGPTLPPNTTSTATTTTGTTGAPSNPEQAAVETAAKRYMVAFARARGNEACAQLTKQAQAIMASIGGGGCAAGIESLSTGLTPAVKQLFYQPQFQDVTIDGDSAKVSFGGARQLLKLTKVGGVWLISGNLIRRPGG